MDCRQVISEIQPFIDQHTDPKRSLLIQEHVASCPTCSQELKSFKSLISLLNKTDIPRFSATEWDVIHRNITSTITALPVKKNQSALLSFTGFLKAGRWPVKTLAALIVISFISITSIRFLKSTINYPRIVAIDGSAYSKINISGADSRTRAQNNRTLPQGQSIETDYSSSVKIQLDKGSTIQVGRNSSMRIADYETKKTILSLKNGDVLAQVSKRTPDQLFRIETPNAFCEVIGTRFTVTTLHDNFRNRYITTLTVHEGTVQFGSDANHLPVKAGTAVAIFGDSMGTLTSIEDPLIKLLQQRPGYGRYTVLSTPREAQVTIDGIPCGVTPFTGYLPYGNHTINSSKDGFMPWSGAILIDAQQTATIEIDLKKGTPETQHNPVVLAGNDALDNHLLSSAIARINAGDYRNALMQLEKILSDHSSSPTLAAAALSKASLCYKFTGNYSDAVKMLGRLINGKYPSDQRGNALFERGTIYQAMLHDENNAAADFKSYLREFNTGIWIEEATSSLAELAFIKADFKEAADLYQKYCDNFSSNAKREKALFRLAMIYTGNINDPQRAFNICNRLILEFPNSTYTEDALYWSADCLFRQGKTSSALASFSSYIKRYPGGRWSSDVANRLKKFETAGVK